jgi:hypothetical protein
MYPNSMEALGLAATGARGRAGTITAVLEGQTEPRRGAGLVTAVSLVIVLAAVGLLAAVLAFASDGTDQDAEPTAGGATREGLHVGPKRCDDGRRARTVQDPATPWCTLNRAAKAAPRGSDIVVAAGDYPALQIAGNRSQRNLTFVAADPDARPNLAGVSLSRARGITFSGFRFTGGVSIRLSADITIKNNGFASSALYMRQSQRIDVIRNRFRNVRGGERAILAQNTTRAGEPVTEDLVIRGNLFDNIAHDAIAVYNGYRRVVVERNRITRVWSPEGASYHSDAMQFMGGDRLTIRRNVLDDNAQGILIKDGRQANDLIVTRNLITGGGAGLQIFNAPGARVTRNTIWNTRFGTIFRNDAAISGQTSVWLEDNVLDQLIVDATTGASVSGGGGNVFGRGATFGDPAYVGRPRFVDSAEGDYRIRSARPGAGLPAGDPVPGAQAGIP